jgi:hypothetical protein
MIDVNILDYGDSGSGKTRALSTLPTPCHLFGFDPNKFITIIDWINHCDVDAHDYRLFTSEELSKVAASGNNNIISATILERAQRLYSKLWQDVNKLKANPVNAKGEPYKSFGFDSVSFFMEDLIKPYIMAINGRGANYCKPAQKGQDPAFSLSDFGTASELGMNVLEVFLSLPGIKVVTSHGKVSMDKDGAIKEYFSGSFGQDWARTLPRRFNEVYRSVVTPHFVSSNTPNEYHFVTQSEGSWPAKTSFNYWDAQAGELKPILSAKEPCNYSKILAKVEAKQKGVTK